MNIYNVHGYCKTCGIKEGDGHTNECSHRFDRKPDPKPYPLYERLMDDMREKRNKRRDLNEEHGMTRKIDPVEIFINPHVYYELHKSVADNNKFGYLTYDNTFCGAMLKPKPHITIEDRWEIRFGDERPPLGITPRYIMDEIRFNEITTAIREYNKVDLPIPAAWMDEYNEILRRKGVNV